MKSLTDTDLQHALNVKSMLKEKFGDLIFGIFCYGSRVSEQRQDTDFDILIVTSRKIDWKEERIIYKEVFRLGLEKDIQFDVKFFSSEEVNHTYTQMPFLKNVLSSGIAV